MSKTLTSTSKTLPNPSLIPGGANDLRRYNFRALAAEATAKGRVLTTGEAAKHLKPEYRLDL
jgi:hypothetical protein